MSVLGKKTNLNSKFNIDILWNLLSFGGILVMGVLMNTIIIHYHNTETLGVFNQIYAGYILLSQLAVGGVHLSIQKYIPEFIEKKKQINIILTTSLLLSTLTSVVVMGIAFLLKELPGQILNSEGVKEGFWYIIPGLLFFSYNKVLISFHNGARRMKLYAFFQLLRFIFIVIF